MVIRGWSRLLRSNQMTLFRFYIFLGLQAIFEESFLNIFKVNLNCWEHLQGTRKIHLSVSWMEPFTLICSTYEAPFLIPRMSQRCCMWHNAVLTQVNSLHNTMCSLITRISIVTYSPRKSGWVWLPRGVVWVFLGGPMGRVWILAIELSKPKQ